MAFPYKRNRRLRATEAIRQLVQEHHLLPTDFIVPLFLMEGDNKKEEIASMPSYFRYTIDLLIEEVKECYNLGLRSRVTIKLSKFSFYNLSNGSYWLFALADEDGNLKYNLPEESVGFYPHAIIPDKSIVEINLFNENATFDSLSTQKIDSTSSISKLIIDSLPANHLVELLQNERVVKRSVSNTSLILDSLLVGNYEVRIIKDENNNGVWDTGNLINRMQAEVITYFPEKIQIRENWDLEINWKE